MDSKWFQLFEAEQRRLQDEEKRKQNTGPTLIIIIIVIMGIVSDASGADAITLIFGLILPCLFIFGFVSLLLRLGRKSDPVADLRLNLARLISSPEEIALFDSEMIAEPKHTLQVSEVLKICFTDHYLYTVEKDMGLQKITIAEYEEIQTDKFSLDKSWVSTNPYKYHVYLDLYDEDKKKLLSISMEDDYLETLDGLLTDYCPNYRRSERKYT